MRKKTAEKETAKKEKQINNQIKRKKNFELENITSQVGLKILTTPSTDFPLAYRD